MSKKGFLASLIIAIVATLSLSIYTILSVCLPNSGSPSNPKETTVSLAFRSGETVDVLTGCVENKDLTFSVEEGKENPIEYVAESETYVAKDMNSTVTATVKNKKGNKTNYVISVYHHNSGVNAEGANVDYSETEPFIIATKAHLDEYRTKINEERSDAEKSTVSYAVVVADIDLAGENWKPIGSFNNEAKGIVFEGNNHTIKNLTINVTSENYLEFVKSVAFGESDERGFVDLGFFGRIKRNSEIKNINFDGASITVDKEVYSLLTGEISEDADFDIFDELSIGIVAGQANESSFKNVSTKGTIKGFSCRTKSGDINGVGGIVGVIRNSKITDSQVDLKFNDISKEYTQEANENYKDYDATNIGGIVGYAGTYDYSDKFTNSKNLIENCTVSLTAKTYFQNVTFVAGFVAIGLNVDVKDSVVKNIKVEDRTIITDVITKSKDLGYVSSVGGAVGWIYNAKLNNCPEDQRNLFESSIQNVKVENIDVAMYGGNVAGLAIMVGEEAGKSFAGASIKIVDCSVKGSFVATVGAGLARYLYEDAEVSYTENFTGNAVEANISAKSASAIAFELHGTVKGFANSLGEGQTERTQIKVTFNGLQNKLDKDANKEVAFDNTFGSSFGYIKKAERENANEPIVEEFAINIVSNNSMSFSGIAHQSYGAKIRNCDVVATAVSYNYNVQDRNYSTGYMVAGVVANAYENTEIDGVSVNIKVNKGVDANIARGFNFFGGVVARIHDNNVTIKNCSVDADVYANYCYDHSLTINGEQSGKIFLVGGLVGSIQKYAGATAGIDNLAPVLSQEDINNNKALNIIIENNNVKFSIFADFAEPALNDGSNAMGSNGYRVRGIGALVGNFNSYMKAGSYLDLSTNVAEYHVKADKVTFTYAYQDSTKLVAMNTLGLKIENNAISDTICRSYGMSYVLNVNAAYSSFVIENMENITATFENR